jgi:anti-sigma factor (TIGR02949 family)
MVDLSDMCSFIMMRINTFLDNELDEDTANDVREHLSACESCVDEVATWTALRAALKQTYEPEKCPPSLLERVTAQIRASAGA